MLRHTARNWFVLSGFLLIAACASVTSTHKATPTEKNNTALNSQLLPYCEAKRECGYMLPQTGEKIVAPVYKETKRFVRNFGIARRQNGHLLYVNNVGKEIIDSRFDSGSIRHPYFENAFDRAYDYDADLASLRTLTDGKFGVINDQGEVVCEPKYDRRVSFIDGLAIVAVAMDDDEYLYGLVNRACEEVLPVQFSNISQLPNGSRTQFSEGLIAVERDGKWGFLNEEFRIAIPLSYNEVGDFQDGLAYVKSENGKYGYINNTGELVIPFINGQRSNFSNGVTVLLSEGKYSLLSQKGEVINPKKNYSSIGGFQHGVAKVRSDDEIGIGLINTKGEEITALSYSHIGKFNEGFARARIVRENEFEPAEWTFLGIDGKSISNASYSDILDFADGFAAVCVQRMSNNKCAYGYIDYSGEIIIPAQYSAAFSFHEGRAVVRKELNGKYGVIDLEGKMIVPYVYDAISGFRHGYASVHFDDKEYYIDIDGRPIGFELAEVE